MQRASARCALLPVSVWAVAALAGCAAPAERGDGSGAMRTTSVGTDCFNVSLARDFRYLDEHNLIVYAPANRAYHLELSRACIGLRNLTRIGLRSRTDRMCGFAGDAVLVEGPFAERCPVLSVRRLDDAGVDALIARFEGDGEGRDGFEVEVVEELDEADGDGGDADGNAVENGRGDPGDNGR